MSFARQNFGNTMPLFLRTTIALLCSVLGATGADLRLMCDVGGRLLPLVAQEDGALLLSDGDTRVPARKDAKWILEGDIRANSGLIRWAPDYEIYRSREADEDIDAARRWQAHASVNHYAPRQDLDENIIQEDATEDSAPDGAIREIGDTEQNHPDHDKSATSSQESPLFEDWPDAKGKSLVCVLAWLSGGRVVDTAVEPISKSRAESDFSIEHTFSLSDDEVSGQPISLVWMDGAFIAPLPLFDAEPSNDALVAISFDDEPALQKVLKHSIKLGSLSRENETLVAYAAQAGAANTLDEILGIRRNLARKWETPDRLPPLVEAARNGRTQAVERLIHAGAAKKPTYTHGIVALRFAARNGHTKSFRLLLENGIPVHDKVWVIGDHPAKIALEAGYVDIAKSAFEATKEKEKTLANVLFPFQSTDEQFDRLRQWVPDLASKGHTAALEWIFEQTGLGSVEVNAVGRALQAAIGNGHRDTAEFLLRSGADINQSNPNGITPLMFAVESGDPELVSFCLEQGADLHAADNKGLTALHIAALRNSGVIVTQLLDAGADLSICDTGDLTPLDAALLNRAPDVIEPLVSRGACIALGSRQSAALLEAAIRLDVPQPLSRAIDQGWPPESTFSGIWPALRVAEILGAEKCAQVLRDAGATADRNRPFPVVAVEDLDAAPVALKKEPPLDPRPPDEIFEEQEVRAEFLIDAFGRTLFPKILECPDPRLASEAARSILGWRFSPPRKSGEKVAVMISSIVSFPSSRDRIFSIDEIEQPPQLTTTLVPSYPAELADGKRGRVVLEFVINREGRAEEITPVSSSGDVFTKAAVQLLSQTTFVPARHNDVAVNVQLRRSFDFTPPQKR